MDTWTYKMGFPVVAVTRDYATGGATVTQVNNISSHLGPRNKQLVFSSIKSRFLLRKSNDSTDTTVYQWWVPLTWTNGNTIKQRDWLSVDEVSKTISSLATGAGQWVVFNVDQESALLISIQKLKAKQHFNMPQTITASLTMRRTTLYFATNCLPIILAFLIIIVHSFSTMPSTWHSSI